MGIEYRKRCLEYVLQQCREDAIVNMTDDEILAEWGLQRSPSGPLHQAAERISALSGENERLRAGLAELRALSERATPGMYRSNTMASIGQDWPIGVVMDCGDKDHVGKLLITTDSVRASSLNGSDAEADAAFIVAAVNFVRAEIERRGK